MSIPDRLWRIAKGHWEIASGSAETSIEARLAEADAYRELADTLRQSPPLTPSPLSATPPHVGTTPGERPAPVQSPQPGAEGGYDPLAACYLLLRVEPGADLPAVEAAYEARLSEIRPDQHPPGSPERAVLESRRSAVNAAYEKLRDSLNPTETRFERLEF